METAEPRDVMHAQDLGKQEEEELVVLIDGSYLVNGQEFAHIVDNVRFVESISTRAGRSKSRI